MHTSLVRLRAWLLNPDCDRLPAAVDVRCAERLLGFEVRGNLVRDEADLWSQAIEPLSPLWRWAHLGKPPSFEEACNWQTKYRLHSKPNGFTL